MGTWAWSRERERSRERDQERDQEREIERERSRESHAMPWTCPCPRPCPGWHGMSLSWSRSLSLDLSLDLSLLISLDLDLSLLILIKLNTNEEFWSKTYGSLVDILLCNITMATHNTIIEQYMVTKTTQMETKWQVKLNMGSKIQYSIQDTVKPTKDGHPYMGQTTRLWLPCCPALIISLYQNQAYTTPRAPRPLPY